MKSRTARHILANIVAKHIATTLDVYHGENTWLIGIINTMKCRRIVNMKSTTLRYTDNYTDMHYITVH